MRKCYNKVESKLSKFFLPLDVFQPQVEYRLPLRGNPLDECCKSRRIYAPLWSQFLQLFRISSFMKKFCSFFFISYFRYLLMSFFLVFLQSISTQQKSSKALSGCSLEMKSSQHHSTPRSKKEKTHSRPPSPTYAPPPLFVTLLY